MAPPEPQSPAIKRPENPNLEETAEINLKNNFIKMIEPLKEEIKKIP